MHNNLLFLPSKLNEAKLAKIVCNIHEVILYTKMCHTFNTSATKLIFKSISLEKLMLTVGFGFV